ncbi:hypothetical protein MRB53_021366 [Persea americana]|uniref:Uncharacterized protein n=1 Tax=Persea americana TaxID=3435 RepID=A0ACC2L3N8_PERAE|nr:hypothetical protein MRB53_021366 [Persea americana]
MIMVATSLPIRFACHRHDSSNNYQIKLPHKEHACSIVAPTLQKLQLDQARQVIAVGPGSVQVIRFREGLHAAIQDQVSMQLSWTVVETIQMETRAETQWEK